MYAMKFMFFAMGQTMIVIGENTESVKLFLFHYKKKL